MDMPAEKLNQYIDNVPPDGFIGNYSSRSLEILNTQVGEYFSKLEAGHTQYGSISQVDTLNYVSYDPSRRRSTRNTTDNTPQRLGYNCACI